jgi:hypothetical protein
LQGLLICGHCGKRMTVRYHTRKGILIPEYLCQRDGIEHVGRSCQVIPGQDIDSAVGKLLIETLTPVALEVALSVQQELQLRVAEIDHMHRQQVERARYDAELAKRRYMRVDPDNRLVADSLEAEWNEKLRLLNQAQEDYERQLKANEAGLSEKQKADIAALTNDFPRIWNNPQTPQRERKRMVGLLIEDVTLQGDETVTVHVRFKGGTVTSLNLPRPKSAWELRKTAPEAVAEIDRLLNEHTDLEIARILNAQGIVTGEGNSFDETAVQWVRYTYHLKSRFDRLREKGLLTVIEMAGLLNISPYTVKKWGRHGLLNSYVYNDKHERLFEPPDVHPVKWQGKKISKRKPQQMVCFSSPARGAV